MGDKARWAAGQFCQLCLAVSDVMCVRSVLLDGFYNLCFFGYLLNHYMWSTCIIILLYEAYIFIKFVMHEFSLHSITACLMTRSIEWVTHPFSPVHFGWQKAHCYAKIRKCFGAKTPGITNYSAIMPKSGTCTSLLQPQSYMENLNATSKELWTQLGNNLLLKLDHHVRKDRKSDMDTLIARAYIKHY